jgi:1,4-alpha-glucan branching enzyme
MNELETMIAEFPFRVGPNRYSAQNNVKPVNFYCTAPNAKAVCLVGDFNGWNPLANPMERDPVGSWTARVELHHGHHQYLFLVDGEPMLDPNAYGIARNERNERVSLIAVS